MAPDDLYGFQGLFILKGKAMPDHEEETVNQTPEGGAQEDTANQTPEGGVQDKTGIEDTAGAGQEKKEEEGLKAAVVAEQNRRQIAEEQVRLAQAQTQLMQQELARLQQGNQQEQVDPNGYPTWGELQQREAKLVQNIQLQNLRTQCTDLDSVIGANAGQINYQPSEHVRKLVQENPSLFGIDRFIAQGNSQAISVAYQLAKQRQELEELRKVKQAAEEHANINQANNQTVVTSPAAAGGGGGTNLNSQIPDSSSPKFDEFYERVKAGEFDQKG